MVKMKLHTAAAAMATAAATTVKMDNGTHEWQLAKVNNDLSANLLCNFSHASAQHLTL